MEQFIDTVLRLDGFIFDENVLTDSQVSKRYGERDINRQLLLHNIAAHNVLLDLLKTNYYLLEGKTKKDLSKKHKEIFELVFEFLGDFCSGCETNVKSISINLEQL